MIFKKKEINLTKETELIEQKAYLMIQSLSALGIKRAKDAIIKGIKGKARDWVRRGLSDEQIILPYKNSPTCINLFTQIGIEFSDIEKIIKELRGGK